MIRDLILVNVFVKISTFMNDIGKAQLLHKCLEATIAIIWIVDGMLDSRFSGNKIEEGKNISIGYFGCFKVVVVINLVGEGSHDCRQISFYATMVLEK
jgi:hypothetical protein